jgi:dihydropteroate synthase
MDPYPELTALRNAPHILIMGILNVTEDSFSDGGKWLNPQAALQHAQDMMNAGAAIIDIGAESTRPGAHRVPEETELQRDVSMVKALAPLARACWCVISIDTTRASVARACLDAGAQIINDVSGGCLDPHMADLIASRHCLYIVQRWNSWLIGSTFGGTHLKTSTQTVVADVSARLKEQVQNVLNAGVSPSQIIVDPGLGFGIAGPQLNCTLIAHTDQLRQLGYPVLIGASRKRFLRDVAEQGQPSPTAPDSPDSPDSPSHSSVPDLARLDALTAVVSAVAARQGAWAVRVHNVPVNRDAVALQSQLSTANTFNQGSDVQ